MKKQSTGYSLYVIELNNEPMEVYVGQTWHNPEYRLKQHNSGQAKNYAARVFRKGARGKLRPDLYREYPVYPTRKAALEAEIMLADKLFEKGYHVYSDGLKSDTRKKTSHQSNSHAY